MTDSVRFVSNSALAVICLLALFAGGLQAAGFQVASFSLEQVPKAELNLTGSEEGELKTTGTTTTVKLAIPIKLDGRKRVLLNFFTFRVLHQSYENAGATALAFLPAELYTIKYGLVLHQELSPLWSLNVLVQPAILTDFENVSSDHFTLRGGFLFERKVSENLSYAIGGGYSDDFGDEKILPAAWLKWKPSPGWKVDFDIPQKIDISRKLSNRVWLGLVGKATGAHFRIGQATPFIDGSDIRVNRVKYSIVNVGPALKWNISDGVGLLLNGGTSVYRRYQVFDEAGDKLIDSDFESSIFIKATFKYLVGK